MIYTVYLNPTIDKTVYLNEFCYGKTNRPTRVVVDGAGKAINVAVVLKELGADVCCIGLLYNTDGYIIKNRLSEAGISFDFIEVNGDSRVNMKIFDNAQKTITEINESGRPIQEKDLDLVTRKVLDAAEKGDIVVLTGSLPNGCDLGLYAKMIRLLHRKGVRCVLDADGEVLKQGIAEKPYFIKPNIDELEAIFGWEGTSIKKAAESAQKLVREGLPFVMVSMGKEGSLIADKYQVLFAETLKIDVLSTVGAGDSMVAGTVCLLDKDMESALKSGVAAASASIMQEGTKLMRYADYSKLLEQVKVSRIL